MTLPISRPSRWFALVPVFLAGGLLELRSEENLNRRPSICPAGYELAGRYPELTATDVRNLQQLFCSGADTAREADEAVNAALRAKSH